MWSLVVSPASNLETSPASVISKGRRRLASQSPSPERKRNQGDRKEMHTSQENWYKSAYVTRPDGVTFNSMSRFGGGDGVSFNSLGGFGAEAGAGAGDHHYQRRSINVNESAESDMVQPVDGLASQFENVNFFPNESSIDNTRGNQANSGPSWGEPSNGGRHSTGQISSTYGSPYKGVMGKGRGFRPPPLYELPPRFQKQREFPDIGKGRGRTIAASGLSDISNGHSPNDLSSSSLPAANQNSPSSQPVVYRKSQHGNRGRKSASNLNDSFPNCCSDGDDVPTESATGPPSRPRQIEKLMGMFKTTYRAKYIDTHCHLDLMFRREGEEYDFDDYIKKYNSTWAKCYEGCIADFCFPSTWTENTWLWENLLKNKRVWLAFGCHPHNASEYTVAFEKILEERMGHPRVVAVGEMGLDYSKNNQQDHDLQKVVFRKQLTLAMKHGKPLLIHCREAENDCLEIMKELVPRKYPIHRHCFLGSHMDAMPWTDYFENLKLGLTSALYEPRQNQLKLLREFPLERIIIETDAPYFTPNHYPFKQLNGNHPGIGFVVAVKLAEERNLDIEFVLHQIRQNTAELYGIEASM